MYGCGWWTRARSLPHSATARSGSSDDERPSPPAFPCRTGVISPERPIVSETSRRRRVLSTLIEAANADGDPDSRVADAISDDAAPNDSANSDTAAASSRMPSGNLIDRRTLDWFGWPRRHNLQSTRAGIESASAAGSDWNGPHARPFGTVRSGATRGAIT
jgi:hypothetical protein